MKEKTLPTTEEKAKAAKSACTMAGHEGASGQRSTHDTRGA